MATNKDLTWRLGVVDNASSVFGKVADNAQSMTGKIGDSFGKLGGQIGGEFGELLNTTGEGFTKMSEAAENAGAKMAALGVGTTALGIAMMSMSSGDQQAQAQLKTAIEDTGGSWDDYDKKIESAISSGAKYGHTAADTQQALTTLTTATQDPTKALQDMTVTMNLAAAKHESLADAAKQLALVYGGNSKILKQYGIDTQVSAGNTQEADAAIAQLSARLAGQGDASMDSFSGKVSEARAELTNFGSQISEKLGPILTAVGPVLAVVGSGMDILASRRQAAAAAALADAAATETESVALKGTGA